MGSVCGRLCVLITLIFLGFSDQELRADAITSRPYPLEKVAFDQLIVGLGGSITIEWQNQHQIEYCPDETCELFVFSQGTQKALAEDYVLIYLFYLSDYSYLKKWRVLPNIAASAHERLLNIRWKECLSKEEAEKAQCVFKRLLRDRSLKLYFVRYDENVRSVVRGHIKESP